MVIVALGLPYVSFLRTLPDGVVEKSLGIFHWQQLFAILVSDLYAPPRLWNDGRWIRGHPYRRYPHRKWIRYIEEKLSLLQRPVIASQMGFHIWCARTKMKSHYALELAGICVLVDVWSGHGATTDGHKNVVIWTTRLLRTDYRTSKGAKIPSWADTVSYARRSRREVGWSAMYHNTEVEAGILRSWQLVRCGFPFVDGVGSYVGILGTSASSSCIYRLLRNPERGSVW